MTDILIVEDNEELGALIRDFLVRDGFTVTWKTTGEDGLSALKEDKYRLMPSPAVILIPGIYGNTGDGLKAVKKSVEQAVGSDIIFGNT